MEWWGRLVTSTKAFMAAWRQTDLVASEQVGGFGDWNIRRGRYGIYEAYYRNLAYDQVSQFAAQMKKEMRLYHYIRGVYNPVGRYVNLVNSYVYGGALDMRTAEGGAIPIEAENPDVYTALTTLWKASRWQEQKSIYARNAIMMGDSVLKIVDDVGAQRVRLEVLHPAHLKYATFDEVGNIVEAVIEYERDEPRSLADYYPSRGGTQQAAATKNTFTYTEVITKDSFATFRNGEPWAFYEDAAGNGLSAWQNEYGFVPLVLANDSVTGMHWGEPRYGLFKRKIDEANDLVSLLHDQIRKVVIPLLYAEGASGATQIQSGLEEKDAFKILYGPAGSSLNPITADINIADVTVQIGELLKELEDDLPVLALPRIRRRSGDMTAPGVAAGYSDAIAWIEETQGQLNGALVRAHKMALSIGGYQGYPGYESFNLDSFDNGDEEHDIKPRPVIQDKLSRRDRVTLLKDAGAPLRLILKEMDGFTQEEIDEAIADVDAAQAAATGAAARAIYDQAFGQDNSANSDAPGDNSDATQQQ